MRFGNESWTNVLGPRGALTCHMMDVPVNTDKAHSNKILYRHTVM